LAAKLRLLDLSLNAPAGNIALDEALLNFCHAESEQGAASGTLRFWESAAPFVVLGVSGKLREEVDLEACARGGVPIIRRASGGGTVVQGPGCLNFALILPLTDHPELRDLTRSYRAILERVAAALEVPGLELQGTSDLALGGLKVSGNAQKRTRHAVLHHGTLLYAFDVGSVAAWIREPEKQPAYRQRRRHAEFVRNLDLSPAEIRRRIAAAWHAEAEELDASVKSRLLEDVARLTEEKYSRVEWTERF